MSSRRVRWMLVAIAIGGTSVAHAATGSIQLVDSSGFKYFINTDIVFPTSSSASAGMSEASYTHAVAATTQNGGTVSSTLSDAFDGYQSICVRLGAGASTTTLCSKAEHVYDQLGAPPTSDPQCGGRQYVFPEDATTPIHVVRKVYVPTDDAFARWLNVFTNTGATPETVTMVTSNNLGSDASTKVVTTSSGDATVTTGDLWATSFQDFSGTTSDDPRLAHVFQGPERATGMSGITFVDGDDNPFWAYTFDLAPGATAIVMNFVTGQPSRGAAAAKAAELVTLPPTSTACMSDLEKRQVVNFAVRKPIDFVVAPGPGGDSTIRFEQIQSGVPTQVGTLRPFNASFHGGEFVAYSQKDNLLAVGSGPGDTPRVQLFDVSDPAAPIFLSGFLAYTVDSGGVRVAFGDVTGDGRIDLVTAPGPGSEPRVRVFDLADPTHPSRFGRILVYPSSFRGGVFVAAGDLDGDGYADIVTGAGAGTGTEPGPLVRVFSGLDAHELTAFLAYPPGFEGGVTVGIADVAGDPTPEILTGSGPGRPAQVRAFAKTGPSVTSVAAFLPYGSSFTKGVFVSPTQLDGDALAEILTGPMSGPGRVRAFDVTAPTGTSVIPTFLPLPATFQGGVTVSGGR